MLIKELKSSGVKFNKKNVKFITKDESGQIIWLETGTSSAGLEHIIEHHASDFSRALNISKDGIPSYLKNIIKNGKIIDETNSRVGYTKVYKYKSKYYLVTGIGHNGYVVTAYPYNDRGGKYDKH